MQNIVVNKLSTKETNNNSEISNDFKYNLIKQNMTIYPNDIHIDFRDPIDTQIENEYLMNYQKEIKNDTNNSQKKISIQKTDIDKNEEFYMIN